MTTLLLIRHAVCEGAGERLWGRTPGVHLTDEGQRQAHALATSAHFPPIAAIYSSPLERTRETAAPIGLRWHLDVTVEPDLNELDYGEWAGRCIADLLQNPHWHAFNTARALVAPPHGEWMPALQARALVACERIAVRHPNETVAVVTHGDVIRALLCAMNGFSLDDIFEFTVDYASVHIAQATIRTGALQMLPASVDTLTNQQP